MLKGSGFIGPVRAMIRMRVVVVGSGEDRSNLFEENVKLQWETV